MTQWWLSICCDFWLFPLMSGSSILISWFSLPAFHPPYSLSGICSTLPCSGLRTPRRVCQEERCCDWPELTGESSRWTDVCSTPALMDRWDRDRDAQVTQTSVTSSPDRKYPNMSKTTKCMTSGGTSVVKAEGFNPLRWLQLLCAFFFVLTVSWQRSSGEISLFKTKKNYDSIKSLFCFTLLLSLTGKIFTLRKHMRRPVLKQIKWVSTEQLNMMYLQP